MLRLTSAGRPEKQMVQPWGGVLIRKDKSWDGMTYIGEKDGEMGVMGQLATA